MDTCTSYIELECHFFNNVLFGTFPKLLNVVSTCNEQHQWATKCASLLMFARYLNDFLRQKDYKNIVLLQIKTKLSTGLAPS